MNEIEDLIAAATDYRISALAAAQSKQTSKNARDAAIIAEQQAVAALETLKAAIEAFKNS